MKKRNLYVADFDYLFAESDIKDTLSSLEAITSEFCLILKNVGSGVEGQIAEQLKEIHNHLFVVNYTLIIVHKNLDKKMQTYILDIDNIDAFIY